MPTFRADVTFDLAHGCSGGRSEAASWLGHQAGADCIVKESSVTPPSAFGVCAHTNIPLSVLFVPQKERKKTYNPKEGWEDGTPPPHRDFTGRKVCC